MKSLVSILIPAYNAERWIADAIRSALAQTWSRKEIIIVDDGSRDRTLSLAREFASKTVSVVSQENQGAAAARNKAFSMCQGDYVQWGLVAGCHGGSICGFFVPMACLPVPSRDTSCGYKSSRRRRVGT